MADKKKAKAPKASDADAKKTIMDYMSQQNRPYNAVMLYENLHGAVAKTQSVKLLAELAAKGKLVEKTKGKQKIYWPIQEGLEAVDAKGLEKLDKQIETLRDEKKAIAGELAEMQSRNSALQNALTNDQVDAEIQRLTDSNAEMEARLQKLRAGAKLVTKKQKEDAQKKYDQAKQEWKKRKRICTEIIKQVGEAANKKDKEIVKQLELETDESVGVSVTAEDRTGKRRRIEAEGS